MLFIRQGTVVSETKEFRRPYIREAKKKSELFDLKIPLYTYLGTDTDPKWMDLELDQGMAILGLFLVIL